MHFNSQVTKITEDQVMFEKEGETITIDNDYVFAMIGYHPDYDFCNLLVSTFILMNMEPHRYTIPKRMKRTLKTAISLGLSRLAMMRILFYRKR